MKRDGWKVKKLGEVCETITKGTTPKTIGFNYTDFGINFIKVESISESGCFLVDNFAHVSDDCHNALLRSQLKERDLLFSIAGALGRTAIVNKSILPANTNQALAIIRLKDKSDLFLRFLQCYFRSMKVKNYIDSIKVGVAQMNLSLGQLKDFPIIIPPLPEQSRIVEELDLLSNIIEKKRQQLSELDNLAQSIFYDMFGDPVTNEKGWEVITLGDKCDVTSFKRVLIEEVVDEGIPFIRGTELMALSKGENVDFTLFITDEHYARVKAISGVPKVGDLLIPSINAEARIWILNTDKPMYYKDGRVLWVHVDEKSYASECLKYIMHELIKSSYSSVASGATFAELKLFVLRELKTILPPLSLQQLFAKKIEAIEKEKELIKQSIAETEELFNSRMDYYFN